MADKIAPNTKADDWSNYWEGRTGSQAGAALVGVGIENDVEISAFWDEVLTGFKPGSRMLDLACGAGSVIRSADAAGFSNLTGADISSGAIAALGQAFPAARGVVAPADATGLDAGSFDLIVSQFGFEYAGAVKTAPEIARLLAPSGTFTALVHKTGSAIEAEVSEKRAEAQAIMDTQFVQAAKTLFKADSQQGNEPAFNAAAQNFRPAQGALLEIAREKEGLAAHLYSGTQTMFQQRQAYELEDILAWLDGMDAEITAYRGRMQSMVQAAQSEADVKALGKALEAAGLICEPPDIFCTGFEQDELAWIIRAGKAA